jgi:NADPH:quinone reductase-like Zn-dependent oxidoreductase
LPRNGIIWCSGVVGLVVEERTRLLTESGREAVLSPSARLIERGELRAVIGRTFALDQIVEAHRHADTGHKIGNLVVVVSGTDDWNGTGAAPLQ